MTRKPCEEEKKAEAANKQKKLVTVTNGGFLSYGSTRT